MERDLYLHWAAQGLRLPIGTHLVLHEESNPDDILADGPRLGALVEKAAQRFRSPLALPLMDLTLEKAALLASCGLAESDSEPYHFTNPISELPKITLTPRMRAVCEGIRWIAQETILLPVGMAIGPFSLTTKLVSDPITPVFLAGRGATPKEDPEVMLLENMLALATEAVCQYIEQQILAGAKAVIVCEPAANQVYFSPNQLAKSLAVFDRLVMEPNRRIRELLRAHGVDLIFHNCGELVDDMVRRFATLDPAILSLGSSRRLWEDAALVPRTTVLYGNLPTKRFYSDALICLEDVERVARELLQRMRVAQHPFILGSECDVLSVPGHEATMMAKVDAMLNCSED